MIRARHGAEYTGLYHDPVGLNGLYVRIRAVPVRVNDAGAVSAF